jgi:hypothetical protein
VSGAGGVFKLLMRRTEMMEISEMSHNNEPLNNAVVCAVQRVFLCPFS